MKNRRPASLASILLNFFLEICDILLIKRANWLTARSFFPLQLLISQFLGSDGARFFSQERVLFRNMN
jgi:hypothetical protein